MWSASELLKGVLGASAIYFSLFLQSSTRTNSWEASAQCVDINSFDRYRLRKHELATIPLSNVTGRKKSLHMSVAPSGFSRESSWASGQFATSGHQLVVLQWQQRVFSEDSEPCFFC